MNDRELINEMAAAARESLDWGTDEIGFIPTVEDVARVMLEVVRAR